MQNKKALNFGTKFPSLGKIVVIIITSSIIITSTIVITSTIKSIRRIHRGSNSWSFYNLYIYIYILKKMANDILLAIKHIKEVSKKKVTFEKIEQFT